MRVVLLALVALTACKRAQEPAAARVVKGPADAGAAERPWPAGPLVVPPKMIGHAIYFAPKPKTPPDAALDGACKREVADARALGKLDVRRPKREVLPPPSVETLGYFGKSLSAEQRAAVQTTADPMMVIMSGQHPKALRALTVLAACLARATAGLVWDEHTRQMFTAAAFAALRLDGWPAGGDPDVRAHVVVHQYADGELLRGVSLGMDKLGLPDLVVEQYSPTESRMTSVMNLVAQTLFERGRLDVAGVLSVAVPELRHATLRADLQAGLVDAEGRATVRLVQGSRQEGDAENRLIALRLGENTEQQAAFVDALFGRRHDPTTQIEHDDELIAAMERARTGLRKLKAKFVSGLGPTETLTVKAPFRTSTGGNEWMWLQVTAWKGERLRGILDNDPDDVPGLARGARVEVSLATLADYGLYRGEELVEGHEFTKLLQSKLR
jgi:uncharacterized protein YegJ (DUF2314 family)